MVLELRRVVRRVGDFFDIALGIVFIRGGPPQGIGGGGHLIGSVIGRGVGLPQSIRRTNFLART